MRKLPAQVLVAVIHLYQATFGQLFGGNCRFAPSCSDYAIQAIGLNGAAIGGIQALGRIVRCGPWSRGGVDKPAAHRHRRAEGLHHA